MKQQIMRALAWPRTPNQNVRLAIPLLIVALLFGLTSCLPLTPEPGAITQVLDPRISIEPTTAQPGEIVAVTGSGWQADETIYLNLEAVQDGQELSTIIAVAKTNADGDFTISFILPSDAQWTAQPEVTLAARAVTSDLEAQTTLGIIAPITAVPATAVPTATPTTPAPQPAATNRGQVTGDFVNVRQGPSTAYAVLSVAQGGVRFTIRGQNADGNWLRIRLDSGIEGWMSRAFTDFTGTMPFVREVVLPAVVAPAPAILNWRGEYFANRTLAGAPVLVRNDVNLKFDWGFAAPASNVPADDFSARWTRNMVFPAGTYRFFVTADDGVRVWIDGEQVIDEWRDFSARTFSVERTFASSASHAFRVEYYEHTERAVLDFWWERVDEFPQWHGAYFPNRELAGSPALVRNDSAIDFDWGRTSPATQVPSDDFSARWTRNVDFEQGVYRFHAVMDDGLRLYVDGNLIIDQWRDGGVREAVVDYPLNRGTHALRVEYYERSGDAVARIWWEKSGSPIFYPDWKGEYWPNTGLSGNPDHRA